MAGFRIEGNTSGNVAEVDATNNFRVATPLVAAQAGYVANLGRIDAGTAGTARSKPIWATENNSMQVAQSSYFWDDTFNSTSLNTSKYKFFSTTMTAAQAGGFLTTNTGSSVAANVNCAVQTCRVFPIFGNSETRVIFSGGFASGTSHSANNILEIGLFTATLPGVAVPTDGAFFRWNAAGELRGVINYNGTETQTAAITKPADNVNHDFSIHISTEAVLFLIDRELRGVITLSTDAPTLGQPFSQASLPVVIRQYIGAATPGTAMKFNVSDVFVKVVGPDIVRSWSVAKAGFGHIGYQTQNGATPGSTSNLTNAAIPAASALSNTAVGTGNPAGLGGWAHVLPTLAAGTDGILFSYQNPVGSVTQTPRNLIITGVGLQGAVDVIFAGGPVVYLVQVAYGHTAVSLATAETASFVSGGAKAPRKIAIGMDAFAATAAVGTIGQKLQYQFTEPVVLAPGEFIAIVVRNVGTVTTTGSLVYAASFDAVFE